MKILAWQAQDLARQAPQRLLKPLQPKLAPKPVARVVVATAMALALALALALVVLVADLGVAPVLVAVWAMMLAVLLPLAVLLGLPMVGELILVVCSSTQERKCH